MANPSVDRLLRVVSLESGKIRKGEPDDIIRALREPVVARDHDKLDRALELSSGLRLREAQAALPAILANEKLRLPTRLHAALALHRFGDRRGDAYFVDAALTKGKKHSGDTPYEAEWAYLYAIENLPEVMGDDALPILLKIVRQDGNRIDSTVGGALRRLGKLAVPAFAAMLDDLNHVEGQFDAVNALSLMGPDAQAAVPALNRALRRKAVQQSGTITSRIDQSAAFVLGRIGPGAREALPNLYRLTRDDDEEVCAWAREAIELIKQK